MTLAARYKLDNGVLDTGPDALDGINTGVDFVAGKVNGAALFSRTDGDEIALPHASFADLTNPLTWNFWFRTLDATPAAYQILLQRICGTSLIALTLLTTGQFELTCRNDAGSSSFYSAPFTFQDNTWYYITLTWDGAGKRELFVNKVSVGDHTHTGTFTGASSSYHIGRSVNGYDGNADDLRIYDTILSTRDIRKDYVYKGENEIEIAGVDYTKFLSYVIRYSSDVTYNTRSFHFEAIDNLSDDFLNAIVEGAEIKLFVNQDSVYYNVFTGFLLDPDFDEAGNAVIKCKDYTELLHNRIITFTASAETASEIMTRLHSTYFSTSLTTNIVSSIRTYATIWRGRTPLTIGRELAFKELYALYVTPGKVLTFVPEDFTDSGKTFVDETEIEDYKFPTIGSKIRNVIIVEGKAGSPGSPGIKVRRKDPGSITAYQWKEIRIVDPLIETEDEAIEVAEAELAKRKNPLQPGNFQIPLDVTLDGGMVVGVTIPKKGWNDRKFLILKADHDIGNILTTLYVTSFSEDTSTLLSEMLFTMRKSEERSTDDDTPVVDFNVISESVQVEFFITVDRRTLIPARYGTFIYGSKRYGQQGGSWANVINAQKALLTNIGIEAFLRILGQIATVTTLYDNPNANIAAGSGVGAALITETELQIETVRSSIEPTHPLDPSDSDVTIDWEALITDSELNVGTLTEFSMHNDPTTGEMLIRYVDPVGLTKTIDEDIRIMFKGKVSLVGSVAEVALLQRLLDVIAGFSTDYLDNSNAAIEVLDGVAVLHRNGMEVGYPKFKTTLNSIELFQSLFTVPGEIPDASDIDGIDVYDKTSGGTKMLSNAITAFQTVSGEDVKIRQELTIER